MKTGFRIIWLEETDSTNNELKRRFNEIDNLSVVAARCQTAGRGQRGNKWLSKPGENLTFSIFLKPGQDKLPEIKASEQFIISEAATIAVSEMLNQYGIKASIKWPNDIYVRNKKICGMLIENTLSEERVYASIVGIGININQNDFPQELMNPCSMATITHKIFNLQECLDNFLNIFYKYIFSEDTLSLKRKYLSMMYRINEYHQFRDLSDNKIFNGRIKGVSDNARLVVEMLDGNEKEFAFKEISYII